jgi:hypothetical protein
MANVGGNKFENVTFPLVFEDRYFMLEASPEKDVWTVLQLKNGDLIIEVLKNDPHTNPSSEVTTNPTGIITVSDKDSGKFLYKIRPESKSTSIFGSINGKETEIKITDKEIRVGTNTFQNNMVIGSSVGIKVDKNGGVGMGGGLPQELKKFINVETLPRT